jgi:hypothetical protein
LGFDHARGTKTVPLWTTPLLVRNISGNNLGIVEKMPDPPTETVTNKSVDNKAIRHQ